MCRTGPWIPGGTGPWPSRTRPVASVARGDDSTRHLQLVFNTIVQAPAQEGSMTQRRMQMVRKATRRISATTREHGRIPATAAQSRRGLRRCSQGGRCAQRQGECVPVGAGSLHRLACEPRGWKAVYTPVLPRPHFRSARCAITSTGLLLGADHTMASYDLHYVDTEAAGARPP